MPNTKKVEDGEQIVARGATDVALKLGGGPTRDALVDPQPGDYVPDMEEKGYHVGTVRQPADVALTAGGKVVFESTADEGSKFESAADQKARSNAREAANPALYGGDLHVPISVDMSEIGALGSAARLNARGITVTDNKRSGKSETAKAEAKADAVADAQAAEDSK